MILNRRAVPLRIIGLFNSFLGREKNGFMWNHLYGIFLYSLYASKKFL